MAKVIWFGPGLLGGVISPGEEIPPGTLEADRMKQLKKLGKIGEQKKAEKPAAKPGPKPVEKVQK